MTTGSSGDPQHALRLARENGGHSVRPAGDSEANAIVTFLNASTCSSAMLIIDPRTYHQARPVAPKGVKKKQSNWHVYRYGDEKGRGGHVPMHGDSLQINNRGVGLSREYGEEGGGGRGGVQRPA